MTARARLLDVHGVQVLSVPVDEPSIDALGKQLFDRLFAAVGFLLAAPLLLLAALVVRLEGPGPVFFSQQRVGVGGKLFSMYKLRSMREPKPGEDVNAASRYTRIGAFLRKWSIDELPQLWNVLRGDMSLVGPRPERPEYVQLFSQQIRGYDRRHTVRGGLTGLAQVKGLRGATSIVERTRLDIFYAKHRNLWLDLKILMHTLTALIPTSQGIGGELMFLDLVSEVARDRASAKPTVCESEGPITEPALKDEEIGPSIVVA
jgi:lipopolysaccharide/colanic/teichoic acid biosynthesis glycosyltransferase